MVIASRSLSYSRYTATDVTTMEKEVVCETSVTVYVNRKELVTFLCTQDHGRHSN